MSNVYREQLDGTPNETEGSDARSTPLAPPAHSVGVWWALSEAAGEDSTMKPPVSSEAQEQPTRPSFGPAEVLLELSRTAGKVATQAVSLTDSPSADASLPADQSRICLALTAWLALFAQQLLQRPPLRLDESPESGGVVRLNALARDNLIRSLAISAVDIDRIAVTVVAAIDRAASHVLTYGRHEETGLRRALTQAYNAQEYAFTDSDYREARESLVSALCWLNYHELYWIASEVNREIVMSIEELE